MNVGNESDDERMRVLLVEDHLDTLRCLEHLFRRLGYLTRTASTCALARAALQEADGGVDVIVSDVGLPDGDGIALLEELKQRYGVGSVALTAHVMPADIRRYERSSIDCCLRKPCGVRDLRLAIETFAPVNRLPARQSA